MDYNNYMNEEQSVSFDYCSKITGNRTMLFMVVLAIYFITTGTSMVYLMYVLITNPAKVSDTTFEAISFFVFCTFMLIIILFLLWYLIFKPLINKTYSKKILMSEQGIFSQVNDSFIRWDEIKEISIGLKGARNPAISYIFIQRENFKFNTWSLKNVVFDKDLITLECTFDVLDTIDRFYDDEIVNQESYRPKEENRAMIVMMICIITMFIFLAGTFIWILLFL